MRLNCANKSRKLCTIFQIIIIIIASDTKLTLRLIKNNISANYNTSMKFTPIYGHNPIISNEVP